MLSSQYCGSIIDVLSGNSFTIKSSVMKKIIAALSLVFLIACNDSSTTKTSEDTTVNTNRTDTGYGADVTDTSNRMHMDTIHKSDTGKINGTQR